MSDAFTVRAVGFEPYGIDRAGGAEGEQVEQDCLILREAPLPESVLAIAGQAFAPALSGLIKGLEGLRSFDPAEKRG